jgi:hypothetical protein
MKPPSVLAAGAFLALALASPLRAADIYRWVDENGQTHLSDKVPQRYRHSAVKVDPGPTEVSPARQREAQEQNDRLKALADEQEREAREQESGAARTAPVPVAPAIGSRPPSARNADCAERLRRYRESQECFAPYRMANGALRQEAFEVCGPDLPDPSGECVLIDPG